MNTLNIERCVRTALAGTRFDGRFWGALPKDYAQQVLENVKTGSNDYSCFCLVANTQSSTQPGEHWVAYLCDGKSLEFFDSYGSRPSSMAMPSADVWNERSLQSWNSDVCGQYCIYYLFKRAHNASLAQLLRPFSATNEYANDKLVANFVCRQFKHCVSTFTETSTCSQTCVSRKYCSLYCC